MSIYARIELNNGAEMGVTVDFQEASDLFNGIWKECANGGRAGLGKGFIEAKLCVGGTADIWIAKGSLGAEIKFIHVEAGFSGELLSEGLGKEAVIGIEGISGFIVGELYLRAFSCSWHCCGRSWGVCWCWYPTCFSWWSLRYSKQIWGFSSIFRLPNLLCTSWMTTIGCASFSMSEIATKLFNLERGLVKLFEDVKNYAENIQEMMIRFALSSLSVPEYSSIDGKAWSSDPMSDTEVFNNKLKAESTCAVTIGCTGIVRQTWDDAAEGDSIGGWMDPDR
jgi:hypothetical protein